MVKIKQNTHPDTDTDGRIAKNRKTNKSMHVREREKDSKKKKSILKSQNDFFASLLPSSTII